MKRVIPWLLGVLSLVLLTACGQTVSDPKVDNWQKYQKDLSKKMEPMRGLILIWQIKSLRPMGFVSSGNPLIGT